MKTLLFFIKTNPASLKRGLAQFLTISFLCLSISNTHAQNRAIVNPSFEDPGYRGLWPTLTHQNNIPGWSTTANGVNGPIIEIWPFPNGENHVQGAAIILPN